MRKLSKEDVQWSIECLPEDLPVRGNAQASGDSASDKECEDYILRELAFGNCWAWCTIRVTCKWKAWYGVAYLGGVSVQDEGDFTFGNSDYYEQLQYEALEDLNGSLQRAAAELGELE